MPKPLLKVSMSPCLSTESFPSGTQRDRVLLPGNRAGNADRSAVYSCAEDHCPSSQLPCHSPHLPLAHRRKPKAQCVTVAQDGRDASSRAHIWAPLVIRIPPSGWQWILCLCFCFFLSQLGEGGGLGSSQGGKLSPNPFAP